MRRPPAVLVASLAMILAACGGGHQRFSHAAGASASPSAAASSPQGLSAPPPATMGSPLLPAVDEPIPSDAAALAATLATTTTAVRGSIDEWLASGNPSKGDAPRAVVLQALFQQRIYRALGRNPTLLKAALTRMPGWLRDEARANATAHSRLFRLVHPLSDPGAFRTRRPLPAGVLLEYFDEGQRRFGVPWELLAAVNFVESKFGRVRSSSSAGAQGPMQFLPGTWATYGLGGGIHDPHDAILGAANYLHASGSPSNDRKALHTYNPSNDYVDAVSIYADRMSRDQRAFYEYYNWQVFVLTTHGDQRMTGPWPL
jgi:soluble lytic murein transglycosylase-like protein